MLQLWNGGTRWNGKPAVQAPRKGRYECGSGIYMTTRYLTAKKYAAGGKVTTLVTLADDIRWLHDARLPLRDLVEFLDTAPRLKGRKVVKADLLERCVKRGQGLDDLTLVEYLRNVLVNAEALAGQVGLYFAEWLTSKGVDAALHRAHGREQWVIVFNPAVIVKHEVVSATHVPLALYEMPEIELPGAAG